MVKEHLIFDSSFGECAIVWSQNRVFSFYLPEDSVSTLKSKISQAEISRKSSFPPIWVDKLIIKIQKHLVGKLQDFSNVPLVLDCFSDFSQNVYRATRNIPAGSVITYKDICNQLGRPGASRAVGTALGKNPIPLIVPCHRVVSSSGGLGGFSAGGGLQTKISLLKLEGVSLEKPIVLGGPANWEKALIHLKKRDRAFGNLLKTSRPLKFKARLEKDPLFSLVSAITSQQLSTRAAATILKRVLSLISVNGVPKAKKILTTNSESLREAGLSYMKVSYLKDLALRYLEGELPTFDELKGMSNESIVDKLTKIKGIGRWTVEMYLIFNLGRANVFPVLDLGIRKAISINYLNGRMPYDEEMAEFNEMWAPYQSIASLYLWNSLNNK